MPTPGFLPSDTALEAKAATLDEIGEARAASGPAESLGQRVEQPATLEQWAPSEGFERLSGTPGTEGQDVGASSEGRDVGAGAALPQSAAAGAAVTGKHSAGAKKAPAEEAGAPDARSPEAIAALLAERAAMASAMPLSQPLSPASHARSQVTSSPEVDPRNIPSEVNCGDVMSGLSDNTGLRVLFSTPFLNTLRHPPTRLKRCD